MIELLFAGFLVGLSFTMPFGPASAFIVNTGLHMGFLSAWKAVFGVIASNLAFIALTCIGAGVFLETPAIKTTFLFVGGTVLLVLGYRTLRGRQSESRIASREESEKPFAKAIAISTTSPFDWTWWLTVFGTSVVSYSLTETAVFSLGIVLATFSWLSLLCVLSMFGRRYLSKKALSYTNALAALFLFCMGAWFICKGILAISR